jgi:polysaccharide pyruvyl transferase WcaK-like protein
MARKATVASYCCFECRDYYMKAAIWGSYNYGNYGDDIMAVQFALTLKEAGYDPWAYRLDSTTASRFQIRSTQSVHELLEGAKFCLLGGGAMLESGPSENDPDFEALCSANQHINCPIFPISVGGDGQGAISKLSEEKKKFWTSSFCHQATVRLTSDIALLQVLGKNATYYPDILWTVQDFWSIKPRQRDKGITHIGINIPNSMAAKFLVQQLKMIAEIRKDLVFHFVRTYLPSSTIDHEFLTNSNSQYIKNHIYTDPKTTLEFLSSLDLVVSYKLHLGLTALALGTPFLSLGGKGKTRSFLREIGADFAYMPSKAKNTKFLALVSNPENINCFRKRYDWELIEKLKEIGFTHIEHLNKIAKDMLPNDY